MQDEKDLILFENYKKEKAKIKIKAFKNYYCDAIACSIGEFIDYNEKLLNDLSQDDLKILCEYAVLKNKIAGVGELFLKVPDFMFGNEALDKFGVKGYEIISASLIDKIPTKALIGQRLVLEIENLLDYNDDFLSEISFYLAKTKLPIIINLGQDLEEVGKLVNKFSKSPAQILEDYGFLDCECFIKGLNFIDKDDQKILKDYNATCIFSPRSDGEEGKGAINLYNFIYNEIKFGFSSGKCYNIDMLGEVKLALINTSNLMFDANLLNIQDLLDALSTENSMIEIEFDQDAKKSTLLDKRVEIKDEHYLNLRTQVKEIIKKLKEKN